MRFGDCPGTTLTSPSQPLHLFPKFVEVCVSFRQRDRAQDAEAKEQEAEQDAHFDFLQSRDITATAAAVVRRALIWRIGINAGTSSG
jgi:hypothetical protein